MSWSCRLGRRSESANVALGHFCHEVHHLYNCRCSSHRRANIVLGGACVRRGRSRVTADTVAQEEVAALAAIAGPIDRSAPTAALLLLPGCMVVVVVE